MLHYRDVNSVTQGKSTIPKYDLFRAVNHRLVDWKYLINDAKQYVEGWLDAVASIYSNVSMQDLLEYFGVRNEALAIRCQLIQQSLSGSFATVGRSHEVHGDVGVNENHEPLSSRYPRSISSSIWSIFPTGNSYLAAARIASNFLLMFSAG